MACPENLQRYKADGWPQATKIECKQVQETHWVDGNVL